MRLEFFWSTNKTKIMIHDLESDDYFPLQLKRFEILEALDTRIQEDFPDTHTTLCQLYGETKPYRFARVDRFLRCNFSEHDNQADFDEDGNFVFERVSCPLRGFCKDGICEPKITNELSVRECQVICLHVESLSQQEIGDRLFIAKSTVHNHITNIYKKLGFTGKPRPDQLLTNYAYKNHLV